MAYKKIEDYISFADLAIEQHANKNRTIQLLKQFDKTIDWSPVNGLLLSHYPVGKSKPLSAVDAVQVPAASKVVSDSFRPRPRKPDQ